MKKIKIGAEQKSIETNDDFQNNKDIKIKSIFNNGVIITLLIINIIVTIYLFIEDKKNSKLIKEIMDSQKTFTSANKNFKNDIPNDNKEMTDLNSQEIEYDKTKDGNKNNSNLIKEPIDFKSTFNITNKSFINNYPYGDKEMIGLYYPEINYGQIKEGLNSNLISSLVDLINQLEVKLIYLEKEINLTKIVSLYTSRKVLLKELNVSYNEKNLSELHEIINWVIIHKSNQLKGIASDKYLACKYVKLKLGEDLCQQRIAVYNKFEEINFNELSQHGDIVLKISNSCWKNVVIRNNLRKDEIEKKLNLFKKSLQFDHGLIDSQFFHLYSKKRIIVEKRFYPMTDLYQFKFYILNNIIKFIYLEYYITNTHEVYVIYDPNFNFLFKNSKIHTNPIDINSIFEKSLLEKLKQYTLKLSEDFRNFIRVDLYIFHNKIYLSELTFASYNGKYLDRDEKYIKQAVDNFTLIND